MTFNIRYACLLFALLTPATQKAATINGNIVDPTGASIDGFIFAYDNSQHPTSPGILPGLTAIADRNGQFTLRVAQGFYDICAFAPGFSAQCRKVLIKDDAAQQNLHFKLSVDPLVMKERGDYFPSR